MGSRFLTLTVAAATLGMALAMPAAEAKRLGGGRAVGMQRSNLPPAKPPTAPAQGQPATTPNGAPAATPAAAPMAGAAAGAAAAQAGKRSWLGPLAGLAAGIGLAALFSHLGWGEGLANFVTLLLVAVLGFMLLRWAMRRFAGGAAARPAVAAAGGPGGAMQRQAFEPAQPRPANTAATPAALAPVAAAPVAAARLPDGMNEAEFLRLAKQVFLRLQAANDAGDAEDLRRFTTPQLFAALKLDLKERGAGSVQHTDVVQLDAQVIDAGHEQDQEVVSVRFWGLVRESRDAGAQAFDELWHLVRSPGGDWAIAGITPQ